MAKKKRLVDELKTLVTHPVNFFATISPKKSFKQAFFFDVLQTYFGYFSIILFYSFTLSVIIKESIHFPFYGVILTTFVGLPLLSIVYTFLLALISHIILKIAGGKGSYVDTYKVRVYSGFPSAVGMFFFFFGGGLLGIYSLILQVIGYAKVHKISYWRGAIPLIIFTLLSMITMITLFGIILSHFPALDVERQTNETLTVGGYELGEDYYAGHCIKKKEAVFTERETLCLTFYNVSHFETGNNGVHWYDIDAVVKNSTGDIVSYSSKIYDEDGKVYLPGGILNDVGITLPLSDFGSGIYTLSSRIYDRYSVKEVIINNTFRVIRYDDGEELTLDPPVIGYDEGIDAGDCVPVSGKTFSPKHNVCLKPVNVNGFVPDKEGLYWFEMDFIVVNKEGVILDSAVDLFGDEGHVYLTDATLNDHWVIAKNLPPGEYEFQLVVRDRISKRRALINETFTVEG